MAAFAGLMLVGHWLRERPLKTAARQPEELPVNRQGTDTPGGGTASRLRTGAIVAAAAATCLVAISGRSLWIDEAATAVQAMQPDLA